MGPQDRDPDTSRTHLDLFILEDFSRFLSHFDLLLDITGGVETGIMRIEIERVGKGERVGAAWGAVATEADCDGFRTEALYDLVTVAFKIHIPEDRGRAAGGGPSGGVTIRSAART